MKKSIAKGVFFSILCSLFLFSSFTGNQVVKDETLTIVATVTIKQEFKDDVLKAIKAVVEPTRKESGCIFYDVYGDINNPLKYVFIETWKSQAAIDSHMASAHFTDFTKAVEGKTTLEVSILRQKF